MNYKIKFWKILYLKPFYFKLVSLVNYYIAYTWLEKFVVYRRMRLDILNPFLKYYMHSVGNYYLDTYCLLILSRKYLEKKYC